MLESALVFRPNHGTYIGRINNKDHDFIWAIFIQFAKL